MDRSCALVTWKRIISSIASYLLQEPSYLLTQPDDKGILMPHHRSRIPRKLRRTHHWHYISRRDAVFDLQCKYILPDQSSCQWLQQPVQRRVDQP